MKSLRLVSTLLFSTLAACAANHDQAPVNAAAGDPAAVGTFRAELFPALLHDDTYFTIGDDSVTVLKVCSHGKESIKAELTVPATVSDGHFDVKTGGEQSVPFGRGRCTVKIEAGVTAFEIQHDQLLLTPAGGSTFVYGHRKGLAAADRRDAAAHATRDAAIAAKDGAKQAVIGLKDTVLNGAAVVGDQAAKEGNELKNAALNTATKATDATINGATAVRDGAVNTAAAAREVTLNTAKVAQEKAAAAAREAREEAARVREAAKGKVNAIATGAARVVGGARDVVVGFFNRVRAAFGHGLEKVGEDLKKTGAEVKPDGE